MTDEAHTEDDAVPLANRRKRASAGGYTLKLDAPKRPGWQRRFVNGDPSRILRMQELGYTFVNDKPGEGDKRTQGQGTRISRHAGSTEHGQPMQTYLMETPDSQYQIGLQEKEDRLKPFEEAIRRQADPTGELSPDEMYDAGKSSITRG